MSIKGFEEFTEDLTEYEKETLIPLLVSGMKRKVGKANAIVNNVAVKAMKDAGYQITTPRFRKLLHVIRVSGMLKGIVATSKGYYIAETEQEWKDYLQSITERLHHISALQKALSDQYLDWRQKKLL